MAQSAPAAGGQMQQIPPAPSAGVSIPDIRIERRQAPAQPGPAGPAVHVASLHVTGQTKFTETELIAATNFRPDSDLDVAQLRDMAARIAGYYNRHGFFVAQAYLPAQDIKDGSVTIVVVEGRYARVNLHNTTNLSNRVAMGVLSGLDRGDVIASGPLERRLLLLSDLPGVKVHSTLAPGDAPGASDLNIDLSPGHRVSGSLEGDNAGNRYTGAYRAGATLNLNDPLSLGDVASVRVLTSDAGLIYVRGSYQLQVGDGTAGVAYAHFGYRLGKEFASLHASGVEDIASAYASYPLVRSRNDNLFALVNFDDRMFHDHVGSTATNSNKDARVVIFGFNGSHRDGFMGGGQSSFFFYGAYGSLDIQTPLTRAADAAGARTEGEYGKLTFYVDRLQAVSGPLSVYWAVRGQFATKNLDISEKMELGGAYAVRAYPEGEGYGDEGYVATAEARLLLPRLSADMPGRMQLVGFVDTGQVRLATHAWSAGLNRMTRTGAGVGLTWADSNNFQIKVSYAFKVRTGAATSAPDRPGCFWIQIVKFF